MKLKMNSSLSLNHPGAIHPILQIFLVQGTILSPKHQRRPLPFLLSLSFLYGSHFATNEQPALDKSTINPAQIFKSKNLDLSVGDGHASFFPRNRVIGKGLSGGIITRHCGFHIHTGEGSAGIYSTKKGTVLPVVWQHYNSTYDAVF